MEFRDFVTQRLEGMRDRGRMWGTPDTVEALAIQLLEVEVRHYFPEAHDHRPRFVMDAYLAELNRRTGFSFTPLSTRGLEDIGPLLFEICQEVRRELVQRLTKDAAK